MHLEHAIDQLEIAVERQLRLADPAIAEHGEALLEALIPAIREALLGLAQQAAEEIAAQLDGFAVDLRFRDQDHPELVITERAADPAPPIDPMEARITLRLPESLKTTIESAAVAAGESINGWVVDALTSRARTSTRGRTVTTTFRV